MNKISAFTIIVSFICLSLVGLSLVPLLPVKLNPSHELPGFSVTFRMPNASSRVIEMEVTSKLEAMLSRIRGIKTLRSTSGNGYGTITIELDKHTDIDAARLEASTIIRQTWAQLPDGVSYPTIQTKVSNADSSRPFMSFTINAPSTPILIQQYAEEYIRPQLAQLNGVYKVELNGATPMEWRLEYNSEQLKQLNIQPADISTAVRNFYRKEFLGTCDIEDGYNGKKWIRLALVPKVATGQLDTSIIPVKRVNGKTVFLDELVSVTHMEQEPQRYYRINGLNSIYLSITAEEAANQLQLSKTIHQTMKQIQRALPSGYRIHLSYDATEYIHKELDKIYYRTGLTVIILLLFIGLITWRLKYLFLITASLAVNILIAIIFYYLCGLEIQLYSLAGITVSLNLIIDSTIVMADHLAHRHNMKAFISVLAATLTTAGALVIIFFLDERIKLNLQDFAAVVIINLAVSLVVSLFFVPSMMEKMNLLSHKSVHRQNRKWLQIIQNIKRTWIERLFRTQIGRKFTLLHGRKRLIIYFTHIYKKLIVFLFHWRWIAFTILILTFGIPVFLLPEQLEDKGFWNQLYNKTLGSNTYKESVKPIIDKMLGGTLRLFVDEVYEGSYFTRNEEVVLYANANLPNGSTLEQMNSLIKRMETYLSQFHEIRQFHSSIYSAQRGSIQIYFKDEYQNNGFPYTLKSGMINKALQLGGGSWTIYGLQDQGFSNNVRESAGSYRIELYGYNYDELYKWAEQLKTKLLSHRRIKEVLINSQYSWWKDDYQEFYFNLNQERMAQEDINAYSLFSNVQPIFGRNMEITQIVTEKGVEKIKLSSKQSHEYDRWAMQYIPYSSMDNMKSYKLSELATVNKSIMPQEIAKENQQYRLCLQYEYIGSSEMGHKIQKNDVEEFSKLLPMGYTVKIPNSTWGWSSKDNKQYLLLLVVIAIIFFITSILFNSLRLPFAIIFIIPISYIGIFLTFYWFNLNFDQGGFASFILLGGITVNAGIYILNEFNNIRHRHPNLSILSAYVKAWNAKIIPIALTIISTILGFIPFMVAINKEAFWFPLAAGTIGGLIMSVIGIFFFLPILILRKETKKSASSLQMISTFGEIL